MNNVSQSGPFGSLVDLATADLGGKVILANDEFFGSKSNLLKPSDPIFIPGKYTSKGKWMDGWETRRRRMPGHDWCIVKLGAPGCVKGVDVDTSHFIGNHPSFFSLEACVHGRATSSRALTSGKVHWVEVVPRTPLNPGSQNLHAVASLERWTHMRLNIFPDGGVARLRVYGVVLPDWSKHQRRTAIDLAAVLNGGVVVAASDMFFGVRGNLILPGRAKSMAGGWETKRRRGPGNDWAIIRLGREGVIKQIEVDTNHFKGNYPDSCTVDYCYAPDIGADVVAPAAFEWKPLLPQTKLRPHHRQFFQKALSSSSPATHVRLNIFPDGGVSRLRVFGIPA